MTLDFTDFKELYTPTRRPSANRSGITEHVEGMTNEVGSMYMQLQHQAGRKDSQVSTEVPGYILKVSEGRMSEAGPSQPKRTTKEIHPNLPPGLVIGPDGKPCKVCTSWKDWAKSNVQTSQAVSAGPSASDEGKAVSGGMAGFAAMMSGSPSVGGKKTTAVPPRLDRSECPADTTVLGRSTWTFLHTTAAYYPVKAPPETQDNMRRLLGSLSLLYPCLPCQEDFHEKVQQHPPDVSGREGLSRWLCERHNEVNEKLGKETFACDWGNLNQRWKDGPADGSCD